MKLNQSLRFCISADSTRIAVASCGNGPVILRAAHWLSHVDYDLESPVWRPWLHALSARNRFVRYDPRGCGLSDRHVVDLSIEAWHADLDAVARDEAITASAAPEKKPAEPAAVGTVKVTPPTEIGRAHV